MSHAADSAKYMDKVNANTTASKRDLVRAKRGLLIQSTFVDLVNANTTGSKRDLVRAKRGLLIHSQC